MKLGRLLLRVLLGGLFVGHGTQKLFGWFGGQGPGETAEMFERQGLEPGRVQATAAGAAEAGSGALLLAGLETPLAAAGIVATMLTAVKMVHFKNGPWITNDGYEYNLVIIAAVLAIVELGPGPVSLDGLRNRERAGVRWALAALAAGGAGALAEHLWTAREASPEPAQPSAVAGAAAEPVREPVVSG